MLYRTFGILTLTTALLACDGPKPTPAPAPAQPDVVEKSLEFYATRKPFERPVTRAGEVKGLPDVDSATCGRCHTEIYAEWKVSTHARAWLDDDQFQAELSKSRGEHGGDGDVGWLCVNCHTPAIEQLPQLVVGLENDDIGKPKYVDNPTFRPSMQTDAIGCATCHVENGKIYGPWGNTRAPHPVAKRESLLTEEVCTRCHQAETFYESRNLGCFFSTGESWAKSPAAARGETCQHCHMPEVERPLMAGLPARKTRRHWFGGSLIPKKPAFAAELKPLEAVFGDGVSLSIQPWSEQHASAASKQPQMSGPDMKLASEKLVACDGCVELAVVVTNDRAGHQVPTGDPERHVDVLAVARKGGAIVGRSWTRIGSRYQWWPETKMLADTRLDPEQSRVLKLTAPEGSQVELTAWKYRMHQEAFDYHKLEGVAVRGRQFHGSNWVVENGLVRRVDAD